MKTLRLASSLVLALLAALPAHAGSDLGKVDFLASGSPAAQEPFQRGVAALHSFWYDEAAELFRAAQKADPGFAMAYWGEAMTYNHPIWSEQDRESALAVLARLAPTREERLAKAPTEREKGFLEAVEILYGEGDKGVRDAGYAEAMRRLHERDPGDLEAASFYALSLIGPALTGPPGEPRDRPLIRAAAVLEEWFTRNPEHPGVLHYLIHSYDDPLHAPLGLRAARLYARTAPAAHHALHMPSHIFVQLGDWASAAASNESSWAASVAWVKRRDLTLEKQDFHSLSWLAYVYLQQGRRQKALETLEIAREEASKDANPRITGAVQEIAARFAVEMRASVPAGKAPAIAGEVGGCHGAGPGHGRGEGARLLAAGLAAAWRGDLEAAGKAAEELKGLAGEGSGPAYREGANHAMQKEVLALVALKKGNSEEALKLLAEAAELEERMAPPSGPPEPIKPAHELYGETLLELGKPEEAIRQFERALLRMPNRSASLLGAARAAAKLGRSEEARRHYAALAESWRQADPGTPELAEVKSYLKGGSSSRPAGR